MVLKSHVKMASSNSNNFNHSSNSPVLMRNLNVNDLIEDARLSEDRLCTDQEFSSPSPDYEDDEGYDDSINKLYKNECIKDWDFDKIETAYLSEHPEETNRKMLTSILLDPECGPSEYGASNRMVVLRRDLNTPKIFDANAYHNKIITEQDINHLFTGGLLKILRDLLSKKFIIMIQKDNSNDPDIVCSILVSGTLETVLEELNIKFMVQIIYPDSSSKYVELTHSIDNEKLQMVFQLPNNKTVLCVSNIEKDLLHMNLRYAYGDAKYHKNRHRLSKTTITIGTYAMMLKLDSDSLRAALSRINHSWKMSGTWNATPGATVTSFLNPIPIPTMNAPPSPEISMIIAPKSLPPISIAEDGIKEEDEQKQKTKNKEDEIANKNEKEEKEGKCAWKSLNIKDSSLNKDVFSFASKLHANIFVSFDDSLCSAQSESLRKVRHDIQKREYNIAQRAANRLVQMSEVDDTDLGDSDSNSDPTIGCEMDLYGPRDNWKSQHGTDNHKKTVPKDYGSNEEECLSTVFGCYYILYKYRRIFDREAFFHITIPATYTEKFDSELYQQDITESIAELRKLRSKYVMADLLNLEQRHGIYRVVKLSNIVFEIPLEMVLASFQATLQKHTYEQLMINVADESAVKQIFKETESQNSRNWNFPFCTNWCVK